MEEGTALTDIPAPKARTGYTVAWDKTAADLANVTQNMTVTAIETPNEYTITYDAGEGVTSPAPQKVVYDSVVTLFDPSEREEYNFLGWTYNDLAVVSGQKWTIASNVTLEAVWQAKDMCEVTFIQNGKTIKTVKVEKGEDLNVAEIPQTEAKTGYTVTWDYTAEQLENIQGSFTIYAKEDAKEYTVALTAVGNGTVTQQSFVIEYDDTYDLMVYAQANTGWKLLRWERNGEAFATTGAWQLDEANVELTALFTEKVYKVTLNVNGGYAGSLEKQTLTITYGSAYELPKPLYENIPASQQSYEFEAWHVGSATGTKIARTGTWTYDFEEEAVTLYAEWFYCYTGIY